MNLVNRISQPSTNATAPEAGGKPYPPSASTSPEAVNWILPPFEDDPPQEIKGRSAIAIAASMIKLRFMVDPFIQPDELSSYTPKADNNVLWRTRHAPSVPSAIVSADATCSVE